MINPFHLLARTAIVVGMAVAGLSVTPAIAAHAPGDGFADLAERLLPSVVNISSSQLVSPKKGDEELDGDSPLEQWFHDYLDKHGQGDDEDARPHKRRQTSLGSGFVIDKAGYIVTNNHVIENADKISVILQDDTVLEAKVVGRDTKVDVALLKVNTKRDLKPLAWGNSDAARVGEWVLAIGNPFGLGGSVSAGIISACARDINAGQYDDFLQTDAAINRGNSGGPLLNQNGEVIGINTAIYSVGGGSAGVGFAASANLVRPVLDDIRKFGHTRRGWLGVAIQTVTPEIAESLGLDRGRGALVSAVNADGPAAKSAVQVGDVIVSFDGKPIIKMRELPRLVASTPVDRMVNVEVWRKGKQLPVKLKVGELKEEPVASTSATDDDTQAPIVRTDLKELGLSVAEISDHARDKYEISEDIKGIVVVDVDQDMDAAQKGLHRGDVIDEIQQAPVATPADAQAAIQSATKAGRKTILLRVVSGDDVHYVGVKLGS